jgi:hypothetical protein
MRASDRRFFGGLVVGLASAGVAILSFGGIRRIRARRTPEPVRPVIDGARPIDPVKLAARPAEEASMMPPRLESEIEDPEPFSQRW